MLDKLKQNKGTLLALALYTTLTFAGAEYVSSLKFRQVTEMLEVLKDDLYGREVYQYRLFLDLEYARKTDPAKLEELLELLVVNARRRVESSLSLEGLDKDDLANIEAALNYDPSRNAQKITRD